MLKRALAKVLTRVFFRCDRTRGGDKNVPDSLPPPACDEAGYVCVFMVTCWPGRCKNRSQYMGLASWLGTKNTQRRRASLSLDNGKQTFLKGVFPSCFIFMAVFRLHKRQPRSPLHCAVEPPALKIHNNVINRPTLSGYENLQKPTGGTNSEN